jgi:hypothetical protein
MQYLLLALLILNDSAFAFLAPFKPQLTLVTRTYCLKQAKVDADDGITDSKDRRQVFGAMGSIGLALGAGIPTAHADEDSDFSVSFNIQLSDDSEGEVVFKVQS